MLQCHRVSAMFGAWYSVSMGDEGINKWKRKEVVVEVETEIVFFVKKISHACPV